MALLGGLYLFVLDEAVDTPVSVSSHPIETGGVVSDHTRIDPQTLNLSGQILGSGWGDVVARLKRWQWYGFIVNYIGVNIFRSAQITSFSTSHSAKIDVGCEFTMTLQEVRVARNLFVEALGYTGQMAVTVLQNDGTKRILNLSDRSLRYHTIMPGESLFYIAQQYRTNGVSVANLQNLNRNRALFYPGHQGNFDYMLPNAQLLLGEW